MKYLIKGKIILLLLSMLFLTNSCVEMYCALSDSVSDFCYDVRRRENEREEKREEKKEEINVMKKKKRGNIGKKWKK